MSSDQDVPVATPPPASERLRRPTLRSLHPVPNFPQGHRKSMSFVPSPRRPSQYLGPPSMRRASYYPGGGGGDNRSLSTSTTYLPPPPPQMENTYKTEPDRKFSAGEVEATIKLVLERHLAGVSYTAAGVGELTKRLSDVVREAVKGSKLERYKLVSWVVITEKKKHNLRVASRGLWDAQWDGYASYTFENETLYALANVYAVYHE